MKEKEREKYLVSLVSMNKLGNSYKYIMLFLFANNMYINDCQIGCLSTSTDRYEMNSKSCKH